MTYEGPSTADPQARDRVVSSGRGHDPSAPSLYMALPRDLAGGVTHGAEMAYLRLDGDDRAPKRRTIECSVVSRGSGELPAP